jgi:hypothetical protein
MYLDSKNDEFILINLTVETRGIDDLQVNLKKQKQQAK